MTIPNSPPRPSAAAVSGRVKHLTGHGLSIGLLPSWEGRIYRRTVGPAGAVADRPQAAGWAGELGSPVLHLANFALPANRGDYGTGAVEKMGAANVFVALLEFGPDCLGTALYSPVGLPRVQPGQFNPNGLQRRVAGQAGFQHFFTAANRPFCLYVVIGSHRQAVSLTRTVNDVLDQIEVTA